MDAVILFTPTLMSTAVTKTMSLVVIRLVEDNDDEDVDDDDDDDDDDAKLSFSTIGNPTLSR